VPTAQRLTAKRVEEIFMDSFFRNGEDRSNFIKAEGITMTVGFHPERLKSHEQEVVELLAELPDSFKESGGGGMSFLNACMDKNDHHWGEHMNMQQLFQLGLALGKVKLLTPKEMWVVLPGGMPYYVVLDK
jgi:hypothetical protein